MRHSLAQESEYLTVSSAGGSFYSFGGMINELLVEQERAELLVEQSIACGGSG